jgi:hypothetical protein
MAGVCEAHRAAHPAQARAGAQAVGCGSVGENKSWCVGWGCGPGSSAARLPFEALCAMDGEHLHSVFLTHLAKLALRSAMHSTVHTAVHTARRCGSPIAGGTGAGCAAALIHRFKVREEEGERATPLAQTQQLRCSSRALLRGGRRQATGLAARLSSRGQKEAGNVPVEEEILLPRRPRRDAHAVCRWRGQIHESNVLARASRAEAMAPAAVLGWWR